MGIVYKKDRRIFHLFTENFSYYLHVNKYNHLIHLYFGGKMEDISKERCSERYMERYAMFDNEQEVCDEDYYFSSIASMMECASFGKGDKRGSYSIIEGENGIDLTNFLYVDHEITNGISEDYPLPCPRFTKSETETLIIKLKDETRDIYLYLYYVLDTKFNTLLRYSKVQNLCKTPIKIKKLSSMELDLPASDYEILALNGTWGNDRQVERIPLNHSITEISDNHGARGFYYNPSCALVKNGANDDYGEVIGFSYIYSGDFQYQFKVDEIGQTRVLVGFNEETFTYHLENNESLYTPATILVFSDQGINKMTQTFHDVVRERIIPERWAYKERPLLLNSWEAVTFDFDTNKVLSFIDSAKELNIEMVVLDDGWFGHRNADNSSLGDWYLNSEKIDLKKVVDYAHSKGMKFGLWFEPEMISPDSDLYKSHPEYALYCKNAAKPTLFRHQFVLDLVNKDAIDNVFEQMCKVIDEFKFDYVKWDFNRYLSEAYSEVLSKEHKKETHHRFILGVYDLFNRFVKRYPDILLESCASGGGRFDLGMLYFSPQAWCSDETDIALRVDIQYSTNIFYPLSSIGAHISNRKVGTIKDKACLAFFGTYGFEYDITQISDEDKKEIIEFNKIYKDWHYIVTQGDYYSIYDPSKSNYASWNVVTKDKKACAVFFMNHRKETTKARFIKVKGLDDSKYYFNSLTNDIYLGSFYRQVGLNVSAPLDAHFGMMFILKQVPAVAALAYRKTKQQDGGVRRSIF